MKAAIIVGILVVLAGASIILNAFHIHVPFFRVCVGVALGWLGLSLILSALGVDNRWLAFRPREVRIETRQGPIERGDEKTVLFGTGSVDLTAMHPGENAKLNVIFGNAVVRYDPAVPLEVHTSTAFGSTAFSDGADVAFGDRVFRTPACKDAARCAHVDIATVFGTTELLAAVPLS